MRLKAIRILKSSVPRLRKNSFFNAKYVEKAFELPFDTMKHRFIDSTKVAFKDFQKTDYEFSGPFA
jgi:hypothetical protein